MRLAFSKYHGTGNDFIIIDNYHNRLDLSCLTQKVIAGLCDRRFGIGADGLMIIEPTESEDFNMLYYNADGGESSLCGNGSRCIVHFAYRRGYIKDKTTFLAVDGPHNATIQEKISQDQISVQFADIHNIAFDAEACPLIDTGSPHYMIYVDDVQKVDLITAAHQIRYSDHYREKGVNVNFVERQDNHLTVRTYERGVEAETCSCGTGVVASAISYISEKGIDGTHEISVHTKGGILTVRLTKTDQNYHDIWLCGPAVPVYEGEVTI